MKKIGGSYSYLVKDYLGTGSLGAVYRSTLSDGTPIVIKSIDRRSID
jgi:hypothetical protein